MLAIGSDHGGYKLKENIKKYLNEKGILFKDYGTLDGLTCDYPQIAKKVGQAVAEGFCEKGLLFCGTGLGMAIAVNKIKNIRAVCVSESYSAKYSRIHNNANILCLGERVIGAGLAIELIDIFLTTEFEGGRHENRINQIEN